MKSWVSSLLALGLSVGLARAAGEAKTESPQLRDLAWVLGEWEGVFVLPDGYPELGPAGSNVVHIDSWRWARDRKLLSLTLRDEIDGKVVQKGQEFVRFDDATGKLVHWFYGSTGTHGSGVWSRQGESWKLKWQGVDPGGKKIEGTSEQILIDADTYTWQMRDLTEDGQKIPDWPKVTLKKKTAPPDMAFTGADYVEYHKPLLGSWNITVEEGGNVHTGTASWQLAANGKCYLVSLKADGLPAFQAVMGYDAAAKKWIQAGFDTADTFLLSTLEIADMKHGKTMAEGLIGTCEETRSSADGKVTRSTETLSCTEMSARRMVFVWSNRREQGKSLPDWKLIYERR